MSRNGPKNSKIKTVGWTLSFACCAVTRQQSLALLLSIALLAATGCQPMPGTTSPGFSSRLGMGPQNRAMGNAAFNSVSSGESAYGRVAFGPQVSPRGLFGPLMGGGENNLAQGASVNAGAGAFQAPAQVSQAQMPPSSNPFAAQAAATSPGPWNQQLQNLSQQVNRYNIDNADLHQQVASLKQQLQNSAEANSQLQSQLANSATQLAQYQRLIQENEQRLQVLQASAGSGTGFQGATIRANNSLLQNIEKLKIPGVTVEPDKDVIRVLVPSDYLFQTGTYEIQPASSSVINRLAGAIRQYYPAQILGVEAHWSGGQNAVSEHQITTGQAMAVMNQMVSAGVPPSQMFVIGYGANKPKYSNATAQGQSANRRVELVIYPDKF